MAATRLRRRLSRTDTVNRAIQLYAYLDQRRAAEDQVLIRHPDGSCEELTWDVTAAASQIPPHPGRDQLL